MIFVTVGSMLPFDRFVIAMDEWAAAHPDEDVFIQTGAGNYEPKHARSLRMLTPTDFTGKVGEADLIVAHAGMGSVILAAEAGKPIVLFPRRMALGEHTTDHQLHTIGWLKDRPGIYVATDEAELDARIAEASSGHTTTQKLSPHAPSAFVERLRTSILT